ncbi:hypothetical protein F4778DRAFT_167942 [Xylariomycetidae sp. FL2044]|nr:hypothetical protein F4778DRAFT_167942 [Xylariomycetidae sp. FL2044]
MRRDEFSFSGEADFLPTTPGLSIDGIGRIALPLMDGAKAEVIGKVCEQSPFGHDLESLTNTSVRDSWELDPTKLTIDTPSWKSGIEKATRMIAEKLGIPHVAISLFLYKFLLYKKGGHFAEHRNTEKQDGMFAPRVIQLPSEHQGGELVVSEESVRHDLGGSGYILHLLAQIKRSAGSISGLDDELKGNMIAAFRNAAQSGHTFHLLFDHAYTTKSIGALGIAGLKGLDRSPVAILRDTNAAAPPDARFAFFISQAEIGSSYCSKCSGYLGEWQENDPPTEKLTELYFLDIRSLCEPSIKSSRYELVNPSARSRQQLWHGRRQVIYKSRCGF